MEQLTMEQLKKNYQDAIDKLMALGIRFYKLQVKQKENLTKFEQDLIKDLGPNIDIEARNKIHTRIEELNHIIDDDFINTLSSGLSL